MVGQLSEHPLAELIREIRQAELSGALRVSRPPAKIAIYFDKGKTVFAASNLRAHRLREALKRNGISEEQLAGCPAATPDEELANALLKGGVVSREALQSIRAELVQDALRAALLWSEGSWTFDPRVRVAPDLRVDVGLEQLLLEAARHLPFAVIKSRFQNGNATYSVPSAAQLITLLPSEASMLARATAAANPVRLADLVVNGVSEEQVLRSVYGLSLSGALQRSDWPPVLNAVSSDLHQSTPPGVKAAVSAGAAASEQTDLDQFLARMKEARDYYEVLDISRSADLEEVKSSYRTLARNFHPDRFHQSSPELRKSIESAFTRVAQAYETLSDAPRRSRYDQRLSGKQSGRQGQSAAKSKTQSRAESSFLQGMESLKRGQHDEAIRLLSEAATLEPREARYRAFYGSALMKRSNSRRLAETELQAAVALEPQNPTFRLMLAELYQTVGLRRRAQTEAARVLAADPRNEAARTFMTNLSKA